MMQEYILIERGLLDKIETELESVEEANDRIFKAKTIPEDEITDYTEGFFNKIRRGDISLEQTEVKFLEEDNSIEKSVDGKNLEGALIEGENK